MVVPTPPSVDDYTKISYTFNDGALNNTITSMIVNPSKTWLLFYWLYSTVAG